MSELDELIRLSEENKKLKQFAKEILNKEGDDWIGDWDGDELQDLALKCGLLNKVKRNEPCNKGVEETYGCLCNEYGCDFPTECYVVVEFLR